MSRYSLTPMKVVLITLLLASFVVAGRAGGYTPALKTAPAQDEERVVEKLSHNNAPLKIRTMKRKNGEIALGKKFTDKEDWFRGLSFVIENVSGKNIVYVRGGFLFPRQVVVKGQAPPLYHSFHFGLPPFVPEEASSAQQLILKPGETITFTLPESEYSEITANLKRLEYAHSINVIKFNLEEIFFDDGTSWAAGTYFPRDREERQPLSAAPLNYLAPARYNFGELSCYGDLKVFF